MSRLERVWVLLLSEEGVNSGLYFEGAVRVAVIWRAENALGLMDTDCAGRRSLSNSGRLSSHATMLIIAAISYFPIS